MTALLESRGRLCQAGGLLLPLVGLLTVGLLLRVYLMVKYADRWFCSDEAEIGLMAIQFLRDGRLPIFITGVEYGGALGRLVMAFFMFVTGDPALGVKLTPLFFFLLFAVTLFAFARRVLGARIAWLAEVLICLAPPFLSSVGVRERGPHPELLFLGTLLMYLSLHMGRAVRSSSPLVWLGWAFLAGVCWYTYYLAIMYIVPCAVYLIVAAGLGSGWPSRARALLARLGAILIGGAAGASPYLIYALTSRRLPPFSSSAPAYFEPWSGLVVFGKFGFPIIVGARWNFSRTEFVPFFGKLVIFLYFGALAAFFLSLLKGFSMGPLRKAAARLRRLVHRTERGCQDSGLQPAGDGNDACVPAAIWFQKRNGEILLALQIALCPVLFALSRFAWFGEEPRYLVGLYSTLPIVMAWFAVRLAQRSKTLAVLLLFTVVGVSTYGTLNIPAENLLTIFAEPDRPLIDFLREKRLRYFYANYWVSNRVTFESIESLDAPPTGRANPELVGASAFSIPYEAHPERRHQVDAAPNPAFVTWVSEALRFERDLQASRSSYQKAVIGRYVVYYDVKPRRSPWR